MDCFKPYIPLICSFDSMCILERRTLPKAYYFDFYPFIFYIWFNALFICYSAFMMFLRFN